MVVEELDSVLSPKLISQQVEQVTCAECCKYYIAPETAPCGHTLCHSCWIGRRSCHSCAAPIVRKALRLNTPLQKLTEHTHALVDDYEKLFNLKLEEFTLGILDELQTQDPTKNVKEWLANSENHFSAPPQSQVSVAELPQNMELSKSKIQIHTSNNKTKTPEKVLKAPVPQEDWDKIEVLPYTEEVFEKPTNNVIGPMDFEPFFSNENEYSNDHPRRSSRQKELKTDSNAPTYNISNDKNSTKRSNIDSKSLKTKQTWSSVKKMRKEFSKLGKNKQNKSKLNVSIEMCKKAQNVTKKPKQAQTLPQHTDSDQNLMVIDDNTPYVDSTDKEHIPRNCSEEKSQSNKNLKSNVHNDNFCSDEEVLPEMFDKNVTNYPCQNDQTNKVDEKNNENNSDIDIQIKNMEQNKLGSDKAVNIEHSNMSVHSNLKKTHMPFIKKGTLRQKNIASQENDIQISHKEVKSNAVTTDTDNIEISIKIGNTITNIVIKNKGHNVQTRIHTDKEIQTSLGPYGLVDKNDAGCSPMPECNIQNIELKIDENNEVQVNKTPSMKKNTASADTATATAPAQFEITDSMEKELSDVMQHLETRRNKSGLSQKNTQPKQPVSTKSSQNDVMEKEISKVMDELEEKKDEADMQKTSVTTKNSKENEGENGKELDNMEDIDDIFDSGSVKVAKLQKEYHQQANSDILMPTIKSKISQKRNKRQREPNDDEVLLSDKKQKVDSNRSNENQGEVSAIETEAHVNTMGNNSEHMNYDAILTQAFANIDADLQKSQIKEFGTIQSLSLKKRTNEPELLKKESQLQLSQIIHRTQHKQIRKDVSVKDLFVAEIKDDLNKKEDNQKYSENVFSMLEKDSEPPVASGKCNEKIPAPTTQQHIDNLLTPGMCQNLVATQDNLHRDSDIEMIEPIQATPVVDNEDEESVVEETPQKNTSFTKLKQNNEQSKNSIEHQKTRKLATEKENNFELTSETSQIIKSIVNISDTTVMESSKSKDGTAVEDRKTKVSSQKELPSETPLSIDKFVNHIKYNSTPVARKSLNFTENQDDHEQTLCPTTTQENDRGQTPCPTTTQEKEFLAEAFKQTPMSPIKRALTLKNTFNRPAKKFFIAGSCLNANELRNLKILCQQRGWTYLDKYSKELTHLVVGVDEENRSMRSVKYVCSLAASKWIVTYAWVQKCLQTNNAVDETPFEALDASGEPSPRRSRLATTKLFEGMTFYCMPPFSMLPVDSLKQMLECSGGRVVNDPKEVKLTDETTSPALLLAEPEHTQEDRYVFLAMELKVVPVNFEWVLNCLGNYALHSLQEHLLCPPTLLPRAIEKWPSALLELDDTE